MRVGFHTLGCKLNQSETEALADAFTQTGHHPVGLDQEAELYIINTCTVTSKSEQKARRLVRKVLAEHPGRPVVVTGCYAEVERQEVEGLGEGVFAVGLGKKAGLQGLPEALALRGTESPEADIGGLIRIWLRDEETFPAESPAPAGERTPPQGERFRFQASHYSFHTRAFLKIQDGCDNRCSYCRVRIARGPSVSLEAPELLRRFRRLERAGYREIVLTGINLSSYKSDGLDFPGLLRELLSRPGDSRIRISSLEPEAVTEELAILLGNPRICPHFHLSVQSGSDPVLRAMRRRYNRSRVYQAVERLRQVSRRPFIAGDFIVGFPGETEEMHRETLSMVQDLGFAGLHVFPFSPRPGTEAAEMRPRVPERVAGERAVELRELAARELNRFGREAVGSVLDVVVERTDQRRREWTGAAENYLKVRGPLKSGKGIPNKENLHPAPGDRIPVRISSFRDGQAWGDPAGEAIPPMGPKKTGS